MRAFFISQHILLVVALAGLLVVASSSSLDAQQRSTRSGQAEDAQAESPATLWETLADIKAFSRRLDEAETDEQKIDAIVDLSALYLRVVGDPRFAVSERLQGYRGRIAARLKRQENLIARAKHKAARENRGESGRHEGTSLGTPVEETREFSSAVIDRQWRLMTHAVGGAGPSLYHASGMYGTAGHFYRGQHGGIMGDHGAELVNLIQAILHPDFWQENGGSGMTYYYQPLRILVVRATTTVHEDLEQFLERLR